MNRTGVYQIELNGKRYVGSTTKSFDERRKIHLRSLRKGTHNNCHLQRAFNKYGEDALVFSILEIVETSEEVIVIEQKYIDELKPEYNMCPTAGNSLGRKFSKKSRQKMSESQKGKTTWNKGKVDCFSKKTKQKMSESQKGNKNNLGRIFSEEARRKMSEAAKGRIFSMETRQKLREARLGKKLTKKTKQKMSRAAIGNKSNLGRIFSEETRQKMRGRKHTDEARAKMSDAAKKVWEIRKVMDGSLASEVPEENILGK